MDRIAVFLDYGNVHMLGHTLFGYDMDKRQTYVSPRLLADRITSMRKSPSELTDVFLFRGEPSRFRDPAAASVFRKQTARWAKDPLVTGVYLPLRYRYDRRPPKETSVDVRLSLNLVKAAESGKYDTVVVFSGDGDCFPAIEDAAGTHTRVEVAAWTDGTAFTGSLATAWAVNRLNLWCHQLGEDDFWDCQDQTEAAAA